MRSFFTVCLSDVCVLTNATQEELASLMEDTLFGEKPSFDVAPN